MKCAKWLVAMWVAWAVVMTAAVGRGNGTTNVSAWSHHVALGGFTNALRQFEPFPITYVSVVTNTTTNTYAPKQYRTYAIYATFPTTTEAVWQDEPFDGYGRLFGQDNSRDNPNVRITEVRRVRKLEFTFEYRPYSIVLDDVVVSKTRKMRLVKTEEEWIEEPEEQQCLDR